MKRITANKRICQWKEILRQTDNIPTPAFPNEIQENGEDPFDCTDLMIPSTRQLVKEDLQKYKREWEALDSRLIVEEQTNLDRKAKQKRRRMIRDASENVGNEDIHYDEGHPEDDTSVVTAPEAGDYGGVHWGYLANRVRLPDFFDYKSRGPLPQPTQSQSQGEVGKPRRRQVISLQDPTQKLDYEVELWKLFKKIPLEQEIESRSIQGSICTNMIKLNEEIDEGYREYTRLDGHALSRVRKKDRHQWPRVRVKGQIEKRKIKNDGSIGCAAIKMEFWKRQVKRFGSDPNKCEVEFLSTHTLQDVHNVIVECGEDELFQKGAMARVSGLQTIPANATSHASQVRPPSGYFFIEDTFYSTGDVDYVTPIMNWLNEDVNRKKQKFLKCRKKFLKIDPNVELKHKRMQDVKLGDVVMQLGVRYVHACNGDCETAIFFSDVSMRMKDENVNESEYPILHDIWTTSTSSLVHGVAVCEGCDHCPAVVLTLEDEMADGGPTPFCANCYAKLHYDLSKGADEPNLLYNNFKVVPMSVLQNLRGLSVGHDHHDAQF